MLVDGAMPKLCLNMIVKNESRIITRLFDSVVDIIDSYVICDTGSTDNTVSIIQEYFSKRGIKGKILLESFRDFGYNRTYSLLACESDPAEFILLLDADMILEKGSNFNVANFKQYLSTSNANAFYVFQGSPSMSYKNVRIVRNRVGIKYWGVTHEVIQTPDGSKYDNIPIETLFINDVGDGGAKADKYERDIRLLLKGLEDNPNNDRYTFYLANSYREFGDHKKAIETYKKRIEIGGWIEEIWQSHYNIGICYARMGEPEKAIAAWLDAYNCFPARLENMYEIIKHYRITSKHKLVYEFYKMVEQQLEKTRGKHLDHLFVQNDVYDYKIDYEYSISGYYYNPDNKDLERLCMRIIETPSIDASIYSNIMSNYKFYATPLTTFEDVETKALDQILNKAVKHINFVYEGFQYKFYPSTPTVCYSKDNGLITIIRFVNYKIDENGNYINQKQIVTKNILGIVNKAKVYELKYDTMYDATYVGLEDIRLKTDSNSDELRFTANRGLPDGTMYVEYGYINLDSHTIESNLISKQYSDIQQKIEKNWVLFGNSQIIYKWGPLTIMNTEGTILETYQTPHLFKYIRGSTNGVEVGDETWFICHTVSYEARRYYYHILVALDSKTGKLLRWSKYFKLDGKEHVEYILGLTKCPGTNNFLLSYSVNDSCSKYRKISQTELENLFV